ncbi:unnamed protein product [Miscanthus lutarioriparius]|uniref:ATPase AAA-type core domain-containing protein n=1 Tax=Miscanthus lutarioriparius TaxID=422564 RepID=A0A811QPF7_9POAL|nr:unnamed protein product [Miscanthus lutarioriparius]
MSIGERKVANVYLDLTFSWFNYEYARNMSWKYNCNAYIIQRKGWFNYEYARNMSWKYNCNAYIIQRKGILLELNIAVAIEMYISICALLTREISDHHFGNVVRAPVTVVAAAAAMVEMRQRRKPLVLASTQALLDSLPGDRPPPPPQEPVRLRAGVLRFPSGAGAGAEFGELSSFVSLPATALRRLAVVTGTPLLICRCLSRTLTIMLGGLSKQYCLITCPLTTPAQNILSKWSLPLLIMQWASYLVCSQAEEIDATASAGSDLSLHLDLLPCPQVPKYVLHLRVSVVRIPDCGVLASLKINSSFGGSDYQDMVDQALNEYFKFDRFLARGDVFCIQNSWNCGSSCCLACNKQDNKLHPRNMIYFKVTGIEPSDEPILRVNCNETALVLGGAASAAIPLYSFFAASGNSVPLHGEIVEHLASIIAPALCPLDILPKIKFSTFLYGPSVFHCQSQARSARPCVIFFDELDSLAPARGSSADSGGVMDRVVSQDLFIIGATNRPDLLDSTLLRPGRFDKLLYVGVNTDASYRERILKAQTRKYKLHKNVSLLSVAQHCPPNFTGADIYALCADAWFHAAKRSVKTFEIDPSRSNDASAEEVIVEIDDFITVLGDIPPSLSLELQNYEQLRQKIEGPSR